MLEQKHAAIFENFLKLSKRLEISKLTVDEVPAVHEIVSLVYNLMNYCKQLPDVKKAPVFKTREPKNKKKK